MDVQQASSRDQKGDGVNNKLLTVIIFSRKDLISSYLLGIHY